MSEPSVRSGTAGRPKDRRSPTGFVALVGVACAVGIGLGASSAPQVTASDPFEHFPIGDMECTLCHDPETMNSGTWTFALTLPGGVAERTATFPHSRHAPLGCTTCHGRPPKPVQEDFTCGWTCHTPHLQAREMDCRVCHEPPPRWAHEYGVVHRGCTGSLCHSVPVQDVLPWRRPLCMVCHQDLQAYIPEVPLPGAATEITIELDPTAAADTSVVPDTSSAPEAR